MRKLDWKTHGVNIDGNYLSHLRFADDLVLLSESGIQLWHMIQSLNKARKVKLEMNLSKTMLMTNSRDKQQRTTPLLEYVRLFRKAKLRHKEQRVGNTHQSTR